MKTLHMGEAISEFNRLKRNFVCRAVENAHLGAMGATSVEIWTSADGGMLEYRQENGGCSLIIREDRK